MWMGYRLEKADKKPHGEYGSKTDAGYADPGYQKDKKPRYPLKDNGKWDEGRIHSAWNYIHQKANQEPYTAEQVKQIEGRIIDAWKKAIDPKGPPSARKD